MAEKENAKENPVIEEFNDVEGAGKNALILHNDEVNTSDFVIESLIEMGILRVMKNVGRKGRSYHLVKSLE